MSNYSCLYCVPCAEKKNAVLCCPELTPAWEKNTEANHFCGEEYQDNNEIMRFNQCTNKATYILRTIGGTPELRFSPALDFGWQDPAKVPPSYGY